MADDWGIQDRYLDSADAERTVPPASVEQLRAIVGRPPADLDRTAPLVVRPSTRLEQGGEITLESGEVVPVGGDLPLGYHRLRQRDGQQRRLIVSPGRCVLPSRRMWGWAAQLYAARSRDSWGIGDLGDLRTLTRWAGTQGAGFVLVNPLHAVAPVVPQQASPYFPSTRRFRNPIYLRIDDVPGADAVDLSCHGDRLTTTASSTGTRSGR